MNENMNVNMKNNIMIEKYYDFLLVLMIKYLQNLQNNDISKQLAALKNKFRICFPDIFRKGNWI